MYLKLFSIILTLSILTDFTIIKITGRYRYKWLVLSITYALLAAALLYSFKGILLLNWIPFSFFVWWTVKDAALGLLLHKNPFYLGTGRWDRFWAEITKNPLPLKLAGILFSTGLLFVHSPNYLITGFFALWITIIMIAVLIKTI